MAEELSKKDIEKLVKGLKGVKEKNKNPSFNLNSKELLNKEISIKFKSYV